MSKLADKIRRVTAGESTPMGFGAGQRGKPPGLLLVAEVREAAQEGALLEAGADAIVAGPKVKLDRAGAGRLRGLSLLDPGAESDTAEEPEVDFVLVSTDTPATVLAWEKPGLVLEVDANAEDSALRPISALPVEAVLFDLPGDGPLTLGRLMTVQRVAQFAQRPALVGLGAGQGPELARVLRDGGVAGVLLRRATSESVRAWRAALDALPPPPRPRRSEAEAKLPLPMQGRPSGLQGRSGGR
jgi:hypothetical protein